MSEPRNKEETSVLERAKKRKETKGGERAMEKKQPSKKERAKVINGGNE